MNNYAIILIKDKKLSYDLVYSLELIKQEILKFCMKTYLKTELICLFKFFVDIFIIFY